MTRMDWRRIAVATVAGWSTAALLPAGCTDGPGREDLGFLAVATSTCDRLLECGCISVEDAGACSVDADGFFFGFEGLVYDDQCAQAWHAWIRTASCTDLALPDITEVCPIYHGAVFEGLPCQADGLFVTDCGPRLWCISGVCTNATGRAFGGRDEPCDPFFGCDAGLSCGEAGLCGPLPGPGQVCTDGQCAEGSRCEAVSDVDPPICVAGAEIGSRCMGHAECASFNCPAGFCAPPASVGDPCSNTLPCGPDLFCADGVCQGAGGGFCGTFELVWG